MALVVNVITVKPRRWRLLLQNPSHYRTLEKGKELKLILDVGSLKRYNSLD